MKLSRAQIQTNRARIVEMASVLFHESGCDDLGVADLMTMPASRRAGSTSTSAPRPN
jgi:TetR/AcrR family transcriptional repressor of nem operon